MTDGYEKEPPTRIGFASPLSADQRVIVERSIEALRRRADRLNSVRRTADEALAALGPPPPERAKVEVAEDHPAAVAAADAVLREQREAVAAMTFDQPTGVPTPLRSVDASGVAAGAGDEFFVIPYHFDWQWQNGGVASVQLDPANAHVTISALGSRRVDSHAGYGVLLRTDRDHHVSARSLRSSWERYRVWSGATGAVALVEGGMEMTVLENGRLVAVSVDKRFRKRLNPGFWSGPEHAEYDSGGYGTGAPIEVSWFMRRGQEYTLNVGAWVLAEWTDGPHASGNIASASASMIAQVIFMALSHH